MTKDKLWPDSMRMKITQGYISSSINIVEDQNLRRHQSWGDIFLVRSAVPSTKHIWMPGFQRPPTFISVLKGFCPQPSLRLPKLDYRVVVTIRILTKIESVMWHICNVAPKINDRGPLGDGEKGIYRRSRYRMPLSIRLFRVFLLRSLFFFFSLRAFPFLWLGIVFCQFSYECWCLSF